MSLELVLLDSGLFDIADIFYFIPKLIHEFYCFRALVKHINFFEPWAEEILA